MGENVVKETEQFEPAPEGYLYANVDESHKLIIINQIDAQEQGLPLVEFEQGYDGELYEKGYAPTQPEPEDIQEYMRTIRNSYLSYWDFSQLRDAPFSEEEKDTIAAYRQYLRDYTKEEDWWMAEPLKYEDWLVGYKPISK